jgi:hypothetical protein
MEVALLRRKRDPAAASRGVAHGTRQDKRGQKRQTKYREEYNAQQATSAIARSTLAQYAPHMYDEYCSDEQRTVVSEKIPCDVSRVTFKGAETLAAD